MSASTMFPNLPPRFDQLVAAAKSSVNPLAHTLIDAADQTSPSHALQDDFSWNKYKRFCAWTEKSDDYIASYNLYCYECCYDMTPTVQVSVVEIAAPTGELYCNIRKVTCDNSSIVLTRFGGRIKMDNYHSIDAHTAMYDYVHATSKEDADTLSMMLMMLLT